MGENYDSTWLYEPPLPGSVSKEQLEREVAYERLREMHNVYRSGGRVSGSILHPYPPDKKISYNEYAQPIVAMPKLKKDETVNNTDQTEIDDAVREALAKPRREAEIARRVAAVEAIGTEDTHENGTVLRWTRKMQPKSKSASYTYVAVKIDEDMWYVTGTTTVKTGSYKWDELVEWMTTGATVVENLEVAATWTSILT